MIRSDWWWNVEGDEFVEFPIDGKGVTPLASEIINRGPYEEWKRNMLADCRWWKLFADIDDGAESVLPTAQVGNGESMAARCVRRGRIADAHGRKSKAVK